MMDKLPGPEARFGRVRGEAVPRTHRCAIVASVDPVADQRPEFLGNRPLKFDCEVGDASACIQVMWPSDGCGRANVDASGTLAAAIRRRFIGLKREGGEDYAEKKERSQLPGDEHRALALPSDPSQRRVIALQHRTGVDVAALTAAESFKELIQFTKSRGEHFVIVLSPGVARDLVVRPGCARRAGVVGRCVIAGHHNHGAGALENKLWIGSAVRIFLQPVHFARAPVLEPGSEGGGVGRGAGLGDAACVKAQRKCPFLDARFGAGLDYALRVHANAVRAAASRDSAAALCERLVVSSVKSAAEA